MNELQPIGLHNAYSLLVLYGKQIAEAREQLGRLHSALERRRNYVRICDLLTEDRDDEGEQ